MSQSYRLLSDFLKFSQSLKITEKVAFNIASEASYVYIFSRQKLIKIAKNGPFGDFLKTWSSQTVLPGQF